MSCPLNASWDELGGFFNEMTTLGQHSNIICQIFPNFAKPLPELCKIPFGIQIMTARRLDTSQLSHIMNPYPIRGSSSGRRTSLSNLRTGVVVVILTVYRGIQL